MHTHIHTLTCMCTYSNLCTYIVTYFVYQSHLNLHQFYAILNQVGWDTKSDDDHCAKLLRSTVISLLDNFASGDEEVQKEVKRRFNGHFEDASLLPSEYKVVCSYYVIDLIYVICVICYTLFDLYFIHFVTLFHLFYNVISFISLLYFLLNKVVSHFTLL